MRRVLVVAAFIVCSFAFSQVDLEKYQSVRAELTDNRANVEASLVALHSLLKDLFGVEPTASCSVDLVASVHGFDGGAEIGGGSGGGGFAEENYPQGAAHNTSAPLVVLERSIVILDEFEVASRSSLAAIISSNDPETWRAALVTDLHPDSYAHGNLVLFHTLAIIEASGKTVSYGQQVSDDDQVPFPAEVHRIDIDNANLSVWLVDFDYPDMGSLQRIA